MELRKHAWKGILILLVLTLLKPQNTVAHPYQIFQFGSLNDPNFIPMDIVMNETHFFVAVDSNSADTRSYQIFLKNGTLVSTIKTGVPLGATRGLYQNGSHVLIIDWSNNKIKVFDNEGNFLNQFGPDDLDLFNQPHDIEMNGTHIFVADLYSFSIFDDHGNQIKRTPANGVSGTGNGQFQGVRGLALNDTHVHVADYSNKRIQIFDISGDYVSHFYIDPTGNNDLGSAWYPSTVTLTSDYIVVFAQNAGENSLLFFDYQGNFLVRVGRHGTGIDEFNMVGGMVNNDTHVFLANQDGRIQFFKITPFFTVTDTVTETQSITETTINNVTITNPVTDIVTVTDTQPGMTEVVVITEVPPPVTENYTQTVNGTTTSTVLTTLVDRVTTEITNAKSEASWSFTPLLLAPIVVVYFKRRKS